MSFSFLSLFVLLVTLSVQPVHAQQFSPEKFQSDLEGYITKEAHLDDEEADRFFPLYREMLQKQRAVFKKKRALGKKKPDTEEECKKAVQKHDEQELELKRIQQAYHNKFFTVLPATKVYDVLRAEDRFHRKAFKDWRNHKKN